MFLGGSFPARPVHPPVRRAISDLHRASRRLGVDKTTPPPRRRILRKHLGCGHHLSRCKSSLPIAGCSCCTSLHLSLIPQLLTLCAQYLSVTISLIPSLWAFIFVGTFWLTLKYTGNIVNLLMWVLGLGLLVMIHKVNRYVEMEQHRMREGRRWEHHVDDSGRAYRPVRGADRPI